jgi:hypothetical protein
MRKLFVLFCAILFVAPLFSQNTLTVHQKDGQQFSFGFESKPVVTFTDTELIVKSKGIELRYELARFSKFTFDEKEIDDAVIPIVENKASITLDEYTVSISGAKADIIVRLMASDGRTLEQYKTDADGSLTFSIAELPEGTYIIVSESLTCKILKK